MECPQNVFGLLLNQVGVFDVYGRRLERFKAEEVQEASKSRAGSLDRELEKIADEDRRGRGAQWPSEAVNTQGSEVWLRNEVQESCWS